MKRILFLASLLVGLALAFAPIEAPRVVAQTFPGQTSPGYIPIGQGAAQIKWLPITGCTLTSPGALTCPTSSIPVGTPITSGGAANQLLYDTGGTLAEITKCNNGAYQTNGSGVPSCGLLPWADLTGTPNTLAGYGITSPLPVAQGGTAAASASGTALDNITGFSSTGFLQRTGSGAYSFAQVRTQLTANTTYYVNGASGATANCNGQTCQAGSDSNNGLSISTPFMTVQHALDVINSSVDQAGYQATVQLSDATQGSAAAANYKGSCSNSAHGAAYGMWVGSLLVTIQGNTSTPTNVHVTAPNAGNAFSANDYCVLIVNAVQVDDAGSAAAIGFTAEGGIIDFQNTTFGSFNNNAFMFNENKGGFINLLTGNSFSTGGAKQFAQLQAGSTFDCGNNTVSVPNALAFTTFITASGGSKVTRCSSSTFTGAGVAGTTGIRGAFSTGASLTGGSSCASTFPGNSACTFTGFASSDAGDNLTTAIPAASGGTGNLTQTAHGILLGEGASAQGVVGPCSTNQVPVYSSGSSSDPACGSMRQIISSGVTGAMTQATTNYGGIQGGIGTGQTFALTTPLAGTLKNLVLNIGNAPAVGQTVTATLYTGTYAQAVAGTMSASTVTCQISNPNTQCADNTHSVSIAANSVFNWQIVTSATSGSITGLNWAAEFDNP